MNLEKKISHVHLSLLQKQVSFFNRVKLRHCTTDVKPEVPYHSETLLQWGCKDY